MHFNFCSVETASISMKMIETGGQIGEQLNA